MKATTAVTQTLTCNIGDVSTIVNVSWKDTDDNLITGSSAGYTINQGTVNVDTYTQASTLTIDPATLGTLETRSPVTYKCSAVSLQYPYSEESTEQNLVVTFLSFGKFLDSVGFKPILAIDS